MFIVITTFNNILQISNLTSTVITYFIEIFKSSFVVVFVLLFVFNFLYDHLLRIGSHSELWARVKSEVFQLEILLKFHFELHTEPSQLLSFKKENIM